MQKKHLLTLLVIILILGSYSVLPQVYAKNWHTSQSTENSILLKDRGRWSVSVDDYLIDLAGKWKVIRGGQLDTDPVDVPFVYDGWSGTVEVFRDFQLPAHLKDHDWKLVVDGASQSVRVSVNGANIDARHGDDVSFQVELNSRLLRFGGNPNRISISLDQELNLDSSPPLRGSIYSRRRYGGVNRGIYLVAAPVVHIADVQARWVKTTAGTDRGNDDGVIEIEFEIRGLQNVSSSVSYEIVVTNPVDESTVVRQQFQINTISNNIVNKIVRIPVARDRLWNARNTSGLYSARISLSAGNWKHSASALFGVRAFEFSSSEYTRDGVSETVRCVSYVQADQKYGSALPPKLIQSDVALLKELGVNAVRISASSADPYFLDQCDRSGIMVFEELPVFLVPDEILNRREFISSAKDQLEAMIHRDSRFTCIAGWGIGSEINAPNRVNQEYYEQLTNMVHQLDDRPVYASIPFTDQFRVAPLDLVFLELTEYSGWINLNLPKNINGDRPAFVSGLKRTIRPGNLGGWEDPESEAGQAQYIVGRARQAESLAWCKGVIAGDFSDWMGQVPSISSPLRGSTNLYTSGITTSNRQMRPAFQRLKEYWASETVEPLTRGSYSVGNSALLVIVGFVLILVLVIAMRQNNIFRINLVRTLSSPRGFFQDISDFRYFQTGHTQLLSILISGGVGLIGAGWTHAHRTSYAVDWMVGYLVGSSDLIHWVSTLFWQPFRAFLFFWLLALILIWMGALQSAFISSLHKRKYSLVQSLDFIIWSGVVMLGLLPLGLVAGRLFGTPWGWLVTTIVVILIFWSLVRLYWVYLHHIHKPVSMVLVLWITPPMLILVGIIWGLDWTRSVFAYWNFITHTIVN